jgi:thiamine-monophosphate kinase
MPTPGEFEIIARYFTRPCEDTRVRVGIGDDAAIVDAAGVLAIAVDMLVAGTHFPADLTPKSVGHRALAVNLSDLAAMGASPRWATLALSLPAADTGWLEAFATGFFDLADRFDVSLIGGDTTRGPLTVTVQIIGDAGSGPLLRSGAMPGDRVFVSGSLGDSAAALGHFATPASERTPEVATLIERFSFPEPRVTLGAALCGLATAAIDVSDGLLADLGHVCEQSGCGAVIDLDSLPLSAALQAISSRDEAETFALGGGDDYELCFTCRAGDADGVRAAAAAAGTPVTEIGFVSEGKGIRAQRGGRDVALEVPGFVHF